MSEGYARETALVSEESDLYDRALDVGIGMTIVSFLLGLLTLVRLIELTASGNALRMPMFGLLAFGIAGIGVVGSLSYLGILPVTSQRVRGVGIGLVIALVGLVGVAAVAPASMATLLGIGLLTQAGVVLVAGVASWMDVVPTEPSPSPGLLAGVMFGIVGLLIGAALGVSVVPGGGAATILTTLVGGVGLGALTVLPREDVGTAVPTVILVGLLGLLIVSGTIGPDWVWSPGENIDGDFTGTVMVPLFVLVGSVVASWGAAKSRAGYGAVGRQYGAYLVVYLNALLMVAVMLSIVAFVVMKGLTYAFHGITVGALTALVLLSPLLVVVANWARTPAGTADWHSGARQAVRAIPVAVLGGFAGLLAVAQVTGTTLELPFEFTIQVNRQEQQLDTAATIVTEPAVGNLIVIVSGLFLVWYFMRRYGTIRSAGEYSERVVIAERWIGIGVGLIALVSVVLFLAGSSPFGVPLGGTLGLVVVAVAALSAAALVVGALGVTLASDGAIAEGAVSKAQFIRLGIFGGLVLVLAAAVLQPFAGVTPGVAGFDVVPIAALVSLVAAATIAVATARAARGDVEEAPARVLRRESALGMVGVAGFAVVAAVHVALTGSPVTIGGFTLGVTGTLDWPMTMSPYIPLGPQPGGIMPAVVGTVWLVVGASLFAVPLGVGAAVFLTEYAEQGRFTSVVEIATNSLWSTPSVVFGLFGAAFLIPRLGGDESLMTGQLVLGFMLLPLVLITSREAIKSVPDEYRDASAALGVSQWETIRSVVIPASMPGVITGVILGVGRIAGETAPLILVLGSTLNSTEAIDVLGGFQFIGQPPFIENPTLLESSAAVPTQVWAVIAAGVSGSQSMGWASALVLLMIVLSFYAVGITARTYFRRKLDYE